VLPNPESELEGVLMLFVGDDWAEDHHDVEVVDDQGNRLARRRLPEGFDGIAALHTLIATHLPEEWTDLEPGQAQALVKVGIETDRGPWVAALVAAGYEVYAINPLSVARYRERHSTSGAKSDAADAHLLAEIVRLDRHHHRPIAGDSDNAEAIKLVARTHQSLIWDRTRHLLRLRAALRDFFPAAIEAFPDLDAPDVLELLAKAPDPTRAGRLTRGQIAAALRRANRRDVDAKADHIRQILRAEQLHRSTAVESVYAAIVTGQVAILQTLNTQINQLGTVVADHLAGTRTLRSTPARPASASSSAPGSWVSSATTPTAMPMRKLVRTTPAPHPSPSHQAAGRSFWPATPATDDSPMPCSNGRLDRCAAQPAPGPTTKHSATAASATMPQCDNSPTDSSASSTAASRPEPITTNTPPGPTTSARPLDTGRTWDVCRDPRELR
jgi:transposase